MHDTLEEIALSVIVLFPKPRKNTQPLAFLIQVKTCAVRTAKVEYLYEVTALDK
jgi:hypothetical protein